MIYLDNSATTRVSQKAVEKMRLAAFDLYGNPSSSHAWGAASEKLMEEARANILNALGEKKRDGGRLVFCGSGTEANNLAIFGVIYAKAYNRGKKIITSEGEHPSIEEPLRRLESEGYKIIRIPTKGGVLDIEALGAAADADTALATIMLVNNETGARYGVEQAFKIVKAANPAAVCHTDATQGFLKDNFTLSSLGADLITVSGHKIHAPKGIGALYVSGEIIKSKRLVPYILGGGQEGGFRSGTENVPGAAAFGEAVKEAFDIENVAEARTFILNNLPRGVKANIAPISAPHIMSLTLPKIKSETMLNFLSAREIYISKGSACSSRSHKKNRALEAFGLTAAEAECTIRVSLGSGESMDDIKTFIAAFKEGTETLIKMK